MEARGPWLPPRSQRAERVGHVPDDFRAHPDVQERDHPVWPRRAGGARCRGCQECLVRRARRHLLGDRRQQRRRQVHARAHPRRIPPRVRTSVDLPAPLLPTIPKEVPSGTSNETFLTASTSRTARSPRPNRVIALLNVGVRSKVVRNVTDTFCTLTAGREPGAPGFHTVDSEADSELTLPGDEEQRAENKRPRGPDHSGYPDTEGGNIAADQEVGPSAQHAEQRVEVHERLELGGYVLGVPDHRREVQPDPQEVGQEARGVSEVDLQGGEDRRQARREDY